MNRETYTDKTFVALLGAAVDGIVVIDCHGIIEVVNPAVQKLFGYKYGELIGKNVSLLMPANDRDHHNGYISKYLLTGERKMIGIGRETIGQKKDKSCFPMYLSVGPTDDKDNLKFVGIIRDLTEQKREHKMLIERDQEIHQLSEKLVHVARISALGEMVTGIAHEVNQPLTAIATYVQGCIRLIQSGKSKPEQLLDALDRTSNQAQRMAKVITRIRDFSKKSPIVRDYYDCNELITEVVKLAEIHAAELGVSLILDLANDAKPLMVLVDIIQTQQVALNLINNAIESMAAIEDNKSSVQQSVIIRTQRVEESMIKISIVDRGEGIDRELEHQIFDTFFSTKSTGLGMGLSICQSIVSSQGGTLAFKRNQERGCTFSFTLPESKGGSV